MYAHLSDITHDLLFPQSSDGGYTRNNSHYYYLRHSSSQFLSNAYDNLADCLYCYNYQAPRFNSIRLHNQLLKRSVLTKLPFQPHFVATNACTCTHLPSTAISHASQRNNSHLLNNRYCKSQVGILVVHCNHLSPHPGRLKEIVTVPAFTLGYSITIGLCVS